MVVHAEPIAGEAAEQLPQRNAEFLRLQVVKGLIDAGQGGHGDDSALEERIAVHRLPQMFGAQRVLAHDERREILDGADDRARLEFQRRLAEAVEAGDVGFDADEHPIAQLRVDDDSLDGGDLH